MRTVRWIFTMAIAIGVVAIPGLANANGGAYFNGLQGYYVGGDPDDPVDASYHAKIPTDEQGILDQGPFNVYLMPDTSIIHEGKPIPNDAILVDTIEIASTGGNTFSFSTHFTVPDVPTGYYKIEVCNSPCTISGFREPIGGYFQVVATPLEAELLKEQAKLTSQLFGAKRELRKTTEQLDEITVDLESAQLSRDTLVTRVTELEDQIADLHTAAASAAAEPEPLIDPWVGGLVAIGLGLVAAALIRKRGPRSGGNEDAGTPAPDGNGHGKVRDLSDDKVPVTR